MWFKNYAFQGMLKLSNFDKEKREFGKRTSTTTNPYIELNREVLALTYNTLANEVGNKELTDEQVKALENGISFKKIYTYYLTKHNYVTDINKSNEGIWVKYDQGSDSKILCDSLQGKNTGWCTAGYETAKNQLDGGDFYIYYTKDSEGEYTEPRIAIRMNGHDQIGEVRGISTEQNLESDMIDIADKKLDEFPNKKYYQKKVHDMKLLTLIDKKTTIGQDLTKDELKFLYEMDYDIDGFGYSRDPRIEEIINRRDIKKDMSFVLDCSEEQIVLNEEEYINAINKGIEVEYSFGSLIVNSIRTIDTIVLPKKTFGGIYFPNLEKANKIIIPEDVNYYIEFEGLRDVNDIIVDKNFQGHLTFNKLSKLQNMNVLSNCSGSISLENLRIASGLKIGDNFHGYLDLSGLQTTFGLYIKDDFMGGLNLLAIKTLRDFKFPENMTELYLYSLEEVSSVVFPKHLNESFDLSSLRKANNTTFPEYIDGDFVLLNLKSAKNLKFPRYIGQVLEINRLIDTEVLELPESYKDNTEVITYAQIKYVPNEIYFNEEKETNIIHK